MNKLRVVCAGLIGNVLEWYDFAIYGFFALTIGALFFPSDNPAVSVIAAFGAFAAGFLVRPLGGLAFGWIGDRIGRQRALVLSVMAMAVPTVLMGLMPTYEQIGIFAPILIVLLRIVQGLSVGGEFTGSIVYLVENAPSNRRSFTGVWSYFGATAGTLLGSAVAWTINAIFPADVVADWAWRLPFLLGGIVAVTGFLIRRNMTESEHKVVSDNPLVETFTDHWRDVLRLAALNIGLGIGFYAAFVYAVTYMKEYNGLSSETALTVNTEAMLVLLVLLPITALISDRIGRRPMLITGAAILTFGSIPAFGLIHGGTATLTLIGDLLFVSGIAIMIGGTAGANVELLAARVRCTALSFSYNASIGLFGGTTPMIAAALIASSGNPVAPGYWVAAGGLVSLITALFFIKETRWLPLDHQ